MICWTSLSFISAYSALSIVGNRYNHVRFVADLSDSVMYTSLLVACTSLDPSPPPPSSGQDSNQCAGLSDSVSSHLPLSVCLVCLSLCLSSGLCLLSLCSASVHLCVCACTRAHSLLFTHWVQRETERVTEREREREIVVCVCACVCACVCVCVCVCV